MQWHSWRGVKRITIDSLAMLLLLPCMALLARRSSTINSQHFDAHAYATECMRIDFHEVITAATSVLFLQWQFLFLRDTEAVLADANSYSQDKEMEALVCAITK